MNEHELDLALDAIVQGRTQVTAPPVLREQVRAVPVQTPEQRPWLPTLTGRFQSMFSATKLVVAGAIVALFGGFLVFSQPFEQQEPTVPAAATDDGSSSPVMVYGRTKPECGLFGDDGLREGRTESTSAGCGLIASSDARLQGHLTGVTSQRYLDEETQVYSETLLILNEGGRWYGTAIGAVLGDGGSVDVFGEMSPYWTAVLTGADGHEGLTAFLSSAGIDGQLHGQYRGVIFEGQMPAQPEHFCDIANDPERMASFEFVHPWADDITTSACQETPSAPAMPPGDFDWLMPDPPG